MHSTLWPDLITFDERIRSLENSLKAASAGSEQTSPATMHQDSALVILDLVDVRIRANWPYVRERRSHCATDSELGARIRSRPQAHADPAPDGT